MARLKSSARSPSRSIDINKYQWDSYGHWDPVLLGRGEAVVEMDPVNLEPVLPAFHQAADSLLDPE